MKTGAETYSSAIEGADRYTSWIVANFRPFIGLSVLEVGVGHGAYRRYLPENIIYHGLDIDADKIAEVSKKYPNDDLVQGDISDAASMTALLGKAIDTILCVNVLEHIDDDEEALTNLLTILDKNGRLFLFVPAFPALYNSLDELAGHCRRYRRADMVQLTSKLNAELIDCRYFNPIGGIGWWVNGLFRFKSLNSSAVNAQITLFDRFIVPISRVLDPITRKIFGQSLIAVIQKK